MTQRCIQHSIPVREIRALIAERTRDNKEPHLISSTMRVRKYYATVNHLMKILEPFDEFDTVDLHECGKKARLKLSERIDELLERLEIVKENMRVLCLLLREEK